MKRLLLPSAILAIAFTATAATDPVPGYPTDFNAVFQVRDDIGIVKGDFVAPTEDNSYPAGQLTQPVAKIEVIRECWSIGDNTVVATFENVSPGKKLSFEDTTLPEYGYEYTYTAKSYNSAGESGWGGAYAYVMAGFVLADPEFVSVATADKGLAPLTFTVRCEAFTKDGEALDEPLTSLTLFYETENDEDEVIRNVIVTIDNPESGKEYTATLDEAVEGMTYTFSLVSTSKFGRSENVKKEVYIGEDVPDAVNNLLAEPYGNGALVTWEAPAEGRHHGWVDPAAVRYKVERVVNYNPVLLAQDLAVCEYVDPCEDITQMTSVQYRVTPYNAMGEGVYAASGAVTVGPSATLPFVEHFNSASGYYGVTSDNLWIEEPETYDWDFSTSTWYSEGPSGVRADDENEDGFAYIRFSYVYEDMEHRLVSTPIDLTEAERPVLSFYYLAKAGADNLFKVALRVDGEETEVKEVRLSDNVAVQSEDGANEVADNVWVPCTIELPEFAGKKASIVFNAVFKAGSNCAPVCIDEVTLEDNPTGTGIQNVGAANGATEYYDLTGMRRDDFSRGEIMIKRTVASDGKVTVRKVMK